MSAASSYHRRFPPEIISHCVWLYFRFALSFRDVEEMLAMRGVVLTYETVREWCLKFGQTYANNLRRRAPQPGDRWHLDEVFLKINGRIHYLWRARLIRMEMFWTSWSKAKEIRKPPRSSFASF
jgi:transposase-like protein